jgi:hypothetical protein
VTRSWAVGDRLALIALTYLSLTRGLAYGPWADHETVTSLTFIEQFAPLWVYSIAWFLVTALLTITVTIGRFRATAISIFLALSCLWALSYLGSWIWLDQTRAWVTGSYYLSFALVALGVGYSLPKPSGGR